MNEANPPTTLVIPPELTHGLSVPASHKGPRDKGVIRAAIYARVSTTEQEPENQLGPLQAFAEARGWTTTAYIDRGVSGAKERRPALDALMVAARARKVDVVACVKLDRLARSVHHLVSVAKEFEALGVDLVVLDQAIDTSVPAGRLLFHMLAAIAEFERDLIRDRVVAGVRRARAAGKHLGRPRKYRLDAERVRALHASGLSLSAIGRELGNGKPIHPTVIRRALTAAQMVSPESP